MDLEHCRAVLERAGVKFDSGLTPVELEAAEARFGFTFPQLIPVFGHRYLPDRPAAAGNPVLSVYQTAIIYYGSDLENYLHNEFYYYFGTPDYSLGTSIRDIEFWSWLVALNG